MQETTAKGKSVLWLPLTKQMGHLVCLKSLLPSALGSHLEPNTVFFSSV